MDTTKEDRKMKTNTNRVDRKDVGPHERRLKEFSLRYRRALGLGLDKKEAARQALAEVEALKITGKETRP